jgi:hypothetical protein
MTISQLPGPNAGDEGFALPPEASATPRRQKNTPPEGPKAPRATSIYVSIKNMPDPLFCAAYEEF